MLGLGKIGRNLLIISLLALLSTTEVLACECNYRSVSHRKREAGVVFVGKVISFEKTGHAFRAAVKVIQLWKGVDQAEIVIFTGGGCLAWFEKGEKYLVFATKNKDSGQLETDVCWGNGRAEDRTKEIEKLGKPKVQRTF